MWRWWLAGLLGLGLVVLAGPGRAQTTTTTSTTTTTLVEAVPTNDGYFFGATTNLTLPATKGEMIVYADTRSGSLTVTLPPTSCGCKVAIAKLYDDNLVHVAVANAADEGAAPPPFVRVTAFDLDSKAAAPIVFVSNPPSKTWFLGY